MWIKDLSAFENLDKKNHRNNLPGAGRKPIKEDIEDKLVQFIKRNREIGIAVNSHEVVCEAIRLLPTMANNTYNANMLWFYKFLKRNCFCIRKVTHVDKKLKKDAKAQAVAFFNRLFNIRREFNILDNINQIGNMDETAIYYENLYETTISKIGEKSVTVRNFGKEKLRISAVLCVLADGSKLPPLLIFRGKTNGPKEEELKKNKFVLKGEIFVKCQPNAWTDHDIFMYWVNNIWFSPSIYKSVKQSILILDRATTHFDINLSNYFIANNAKYILIPTGLTSSLQPLDVGINKEIKVFMKQCDCQFRRNNNNSRPPNEGEIIEMFHDIWYNKIQKDSIIKSFKKAGISIKLDGSENNMVDIPENIIENFDVPNELNINEIDNSMVLDDDSNNMFNQMDNSLNNNMKKEDYFK